MPSKSNFPLYSIISNISAINTQFNDSWDESVGLCIDPLMLYAESHQQGHNQRIYRNTMARMGGIDWDDYHFLKEHGVFELNLKIQEQTYENIL